MTDPQSVDDVLTELARAIALAAPTGWERATVSGTIGDDWTYYGGPVHHPEDLTYDGGEVDDMHAQLRRVHQAVEAFDPLLFEFVVHAAGEFDAVTSEALERLEPGFLYLLDRYDLPAEPGELQSGPVDAVPAGDPDMAVELLHRYISHCERILDHPPGELFGRLPRPVALEDATVELPPDLRALYTIIDGDGGVGIFDRHLWFGSEGLSDAYRFWGERDWKGVLSTPALLDGVPYGAVRRAADRPDWIPFAGDTFGNFLAVDLDPGPNGRPGQVIQIGKDHQDGPVYVADSVTTLLRLHVEALERGDYKAADGDVRVDWNGSGPWRTSDPEGDDLRVLRVNGRAALLESLRVETQDLRVANAFEVDLEPVRGATALRRVSLTNCGPADVGPLRDAPIEELALGQDIVDLAPLAGHPTVQRLTIRTPGPVDLTPLLHLPALQMLDLSHAAVRDVSVLAELSGLKYLGLRLEQWTELWQQAGPPPNLAAAGLLGDPSLDQAVDWATQLGDDPHDPAEHQGRYRDPAPRRRFWHSLRET